jgi:hypothetical protein
MDGLHLLAISQNGWKLTVDHERLAINSRQFPAAPQRYAVLSVHYHPLTRNNLDLRGKHSSSEKFLNVLEGSGRFLKQLSSSGCTDKALLGLASYAPPPSLSMAASAAATQGVRLCTQLLVVGRVQVVAASAQQRDMIFTCRLAGVCECVRVVREIEAGASFFGIKSAGAVG